MATRKPLLGLGRSKQTFAVNRCPDQKNNELDVSGIGHLFYSTYPTQLNQFTGSNHYIGRFGHTKINLLVDTSASFPGEGSEFIYV